MLAKHAVELIRARLEGKQARVIFLDRRRLLKQDHRMHAACVTKECNALFAVKQDHHAPRVARNMDCLKRHTAKVKNLARQQRIKWSDTRGHKVVILHALGCPCKALCQELSSIGKIRMPLVHLDICRMHKDSVELSRPARMVNMPVRAYDVVWLARERLDISAQISQTIPGIDKQRAIGSLDQIFTHIGSVRDARNVIGHALGSKRHHKLSPPFKARRT